MTGYRETVGAHLLTFPLIHFNGPLKEATKEPIKRIGREATRNTLHLGMEATCDPGEEYPKIGKSTAHILVDSAP